MDHYLGRHLARSSTSLRRPYLHPQYPVLEEVSWLCDSTRCAVSLLTFHSRTPRQARGRRDEIGVRRKHAESVPQGPNQENFFLTMVTRQKREAE